MQVCQAPKPLLFSERIVKLTPRTEFSAAVNKTDTTVSLSSTSNSHQAHTPIYWKHYGLQSEAWFLQKCKPQFGTLSRLSR